MNKLPRSIQLINEIDGDLNKIRSLIDDLINDVIIILNPTRKIEPSHVPVKKNKNDSPIIESLLCTLQTVKELKLDLRKIKSNIKS